MEDGGRHAAWRVTCKSLPLGPLRAPGAGKGGRAGSVDSAVGVRPRLGWGGTGQKMEAGRWDAAAWRVRVASPVRTAQVRV